jgi:hypothetical protein
MQPRHKPDNTFGTWEEIDKAPAIAAAATSHSESSSSPASSNDADVRAFFVQDPAPTATAATSPSRGRDADAFRVMHSMVQAAAAQDASETLLEPEAGITSAKFDTCGCFCAKVGCRKMVMKHKKGLVCTKCMPQDQWRQCISCEAVVHATCANDLHSWQCPACIASAAIPTTAPSCPLDVNEGQLFDTQPELETFLRQRGYKLNNKQPSGLTYKCNHCSKAFYVKKCGDRWSCPLQIEHVPSCTRPVTAIKAEEGSKIDLGVHLGKTSVRYLHEFAQHPGLLEYIQTVGCTRNIRQDQLAIGVSQLFNVHVESQLLYRTATNAHDDMFGSGRSDVEELLQMEQSVGDHGGYLKLFLGALDCLTVYTL